MKENTDQIYLPERESTSTQRCGDCIYAETQDLIHGSVQCLHDPSTPVTHSIDHLCMQYKYKGSK